MTELPAPDLAAYTEAQIAFAVSAWPMRAAEELRSALVYRGLAHAARDVGIGTAWTMRFFEASHDEIGHARLCADVGARLGAPAPEHDASPVHARLAALPKPMDRLAALVLVEVAIGETISMSLFRAGRRATTEPLSRAALTAILRDEVRHQDLGWSASAVVVPLLSEEQRIGLEREIAFGLAAFERQNVMPAISRLQEGATFDPAYAALGILAPESRIDAFYAAVDQLVVPRLNDLGLNGSRAWADRYRA